MRMDCRAKIKCDAFFALLTLPMRQRLAATVFTSDDDIAGSK